MKKDMASTLLGFIFVAAGFFFLNRELNESPTHPLHLYLASGFAVVGAILVSPDRLTAGIRGAVVPILALLPWTKTARESKAVKAIPAETESLTPES